MGHGMPERPPLVDLSAFEVDGRIGGHAYFRCARTATRPAADVESPKPALAWHRPSARVRRTGTIALTSPVAVLSCFPIMARPDSDTPPWDGNQRVTAKSVLRRAVPWLIGLGLVAAVGLGLKPKPVEVETSLVARAPLTVRVSEEGKTRIRNRYVVAAPVNGRMRRVPLKAGDAVLAGETLLTAIEPVASPLLDPRAKLLAEAIVSSRQANVSLATEALAAAKSVQTMADADLKRVHSIGGDEVLLHPPDTVKDGSLVVKRK